MYLHSVGLQGYVELGLLAYMAAAVDRWHGYQIFLVFSYFQIFGSTEAQQRGGPS